MARRTERLVEDAIELGLRNKRVIELARHHCLHLEFPQFGGYSEVEGQTGLPISMRRPHCAFGRPSVTAGSQLEGLAVQFYRENCVGCAHRNPTGQLPNLANLVEDYDAASAAAAARDEQETALRRAQWAERAERRRAMLVDAGPAMATALADVGIVDGDPVAETDRASIDAAIRRLEALADRAPELFTADVVDHVCGLARDQQLTRLLSPLRRLASGAPQHKAVVVDTAFDVLADRPKEEAARCIVNFREHVTAERFNEQVVEALVVLAGAPKMTGVGQYRPATVSADASGLRLAADLAPDVVTAVLRRLLRTPSSVSELVLPPGSRAAAPPDVASDLRRCAAAGTIRRLAATHPDVAAGLATTLVANLRVDEHDRFGARPVADLQHTLAVLLIRGLGDVIATVNTAAVGADDDVRERLFGVFERADRLLDRWDRWREPGDPNFDDVHRRRCYRAVVEASLARLDGDWGTKAMVQAAALVERAASDEPAWMLADVPALLGVFLLTVGRLEEGPRRSPLTVADATPPEYAALQESSRLYRLSSTASRLLNAVEHIAAADINDVLKALRDIMSAARDDNNETPVARWIVPLIGKLGRAHGTESGVLRSVLTTLYTYLPHTDVVLRSVALDAWTDIAVAHPVPSSVQDMLPRLIQDPYVLVIRSVLRAAQRLTWQEQDRQILLAYAVQVANAETDSDTLKAALRAILALTKEEPFRANAEQFVLQKCRLLDGDDLQRMLRYSWHPTSARTADMAGLRLAQARDPDVNDRFNDREDPELTALLDCGAGLAALPVTELVDAAVELGVELSVPAAEFAEVMWRAGRPGDAATVMTAVLDALPDQPVYVHRRRVARAIQATAALDAATGGPSFRAAWDTAIDACKSLNDTDDWDWTEYRRAMARQIAGQLRARALLGNMQLSADLPTFDDSPADATAPAAGAHPDSDDPALLLRHRANHLSRIGKQMAQGAQRLTATAAYVRAYAALSEVAAHLLRFDAAELDGDATEVVAHQRAAARRAGIVAATLADDLGTDDPIAGPLINALDQTASITSGEDVADLLASWAALPIPLLIVEGPQPRPSTSSSTAADQSAPPASVAVVLAAVDGQLVTGPQVLRPATVYTLRLEVRTGGWPDWADRLDAELVSHLSEAEVELPSFTWQRPRSDAENADTVTGEGTLILRFGLPAGQPALPFRVTLRFRGDRNGERLHQQCDVAGHTELRLRPFDASRDALTQFRVIDERLLRLYEGLHGAGYDEDQVQAFCRLLTAICRAGQEMSFDPRYRRGQRVTERQFHDDLHERLSQDPTLEGRVERGSRLALGFLDVRHNGITAELKVERKTAVTEASATKYIGQPTQYAGADGARLSILCVLDMSPKTSPIGTAENYLWQVRPALHGLTNPEAPSIVTVFVVNGSLPTPSTWSRRRIPTQPPDPAT